MPQTKHYQRWHRDGNVCVYDNHSRLRGGGPLYTDGGRLYNINGTIYRHHNWHQGGKLSLNKDYNAMRVSQTQPCTDAFYLISADF